MVEQIVCGFVFVELLIALYRVFRLAAISNFKLLYFVKNTFLPCLIVGLVTYCLMLMLNRYFSETIVGLVFYAVVSTLFIGVLSYIICLSKKEKALINSLILKFLKK